MAREPIGGALSIQVELEREKASALGAVARKLDKLLAELSELSHQVQTGPQHDRARRVARYTEVRKEAETQQWYLVVQREAMGLTHHADVYDLYRIPPPIER